jgi:EpsD family peptidyl-prolyl cis-trans isomerase
MSRLPTNLTPDAAKAASGQALQQLIDEELLVQKAREAKLDRNPGVMQAIEAAKRSLLANAWLQQAAAGGADPSDQDIKAFYDHHPEIFAERRIYDGRSIPILASPEQVDSIRQQLASTKNLDALLDNLRTQHLAVAVSSFTKSAEQLPPDALARFAALKEGEFITVPYGGGIEVVQVLSSRLEPLSESQARPLIQKYLVEQGRKQRADEAIKSLRVAAAIQIVGDVKPPPAADAIPAKAPPKPGTSDATAGIGAGIK